MSKRAFNISGLNMALIKKMPKFTNKNVSEPVKLKKTNNMKFLLTGGAGAGGIEAIGQIPVTDNTQQYAQLVLQILVAIITIVKLLKSNKTQDND